jgi:hypothetical protein
MNMENYIYRISEATTKEELRQILYAALLQDQHALKKKKSLYEKVLDLCIQREATLGLL